MNPSSVPPSRQRLPAPRHAAPPHRCAAAAPNPAPLSAVAGGGRLLAALALLGALAGCTTPVVDEADRLARAGRYEEAYARLDRALQDAPHDAALRTAHARQRERVLAQALAQAELALAGGRLDQAQRLLERVRTIDPATPRAAALDSQLDAARQARADAARQLAEQARQRAAARTAPPPALPAALAAAYQKPVTLEFREAPLRQVFEALARSTGINVVFDKDVRGDAKLTVFLRNVTLDEALRVVLATQALDRKLLNDSTVLVYPNTPAKQREHQELVTRSLYLRNAEAKALLPLVRTMAKTRDLHADERLNALVLRDTPEVVRQVEALLSALDLPEPEVLLAVEVLEVATSRVEELGLSWPTELQYGLPGASGQVALGERARFRASVANPALVATLRGEDGASNLLANPSIRARNREKAKVQIGEKLPVFSTTSVVNAGVSTSVSYLDVGLKLDVEPSIQLDDEVVIKVGLEVSNLVREVSGPQGALAYQLGSRSTATSLRLRDGETQVLAGLINDEDRKRAVGVPGLAQLPLLGRLFGVHGDTRNKTEIVMLITPHIVRRLTPPGAAQATWPSGTDAQPGAASLRLRPAARVGLAPARGAAAPGTARAPADPPPGAEPPSAEPAAAGPRLLLAATREARVGETVSVTLGNRGGATLSGELVFDAQALQPAAAPASARTPGAPAEATPGRWPFTLPPGGQQVLALRVLAAAAGQAQAIQVAGLMADGDTPPQVDGEALVQVAEATPATAPAAPLPGERRP